MNILITLIASLLSFNLFANCQEYNLLEEHPVLRQMEVRNQGSFSTCYAHSLSAAYEAQTNISLHPYSIAFEHKKRLLHWTPYNLNYSLASFAWKDVSKKGSCHWQEVSEKLNEFRINPNYNDDQVIYGIKGYFEDKDQNVAIAKLLEDPFLDGEKWLKADLEKMFSLISNYPERKFFDFLENRILNGCHKEYPELTLESTGLGFQSNKNLAEIYQTNFKDGNPSVVGYCSRHMQEENYHSVKPRAILAVMPSCGAHYVLIVGQKMIDNKCNILIKNSHSDHFWGHENQSCLCKDQFGKMRLCEKSNFDEQVESVIGCYYDQEKFLNETFDISYLK